MADITTEELKKHNTEDSSWIAIEGKVYDITHFLNDHPGGKEIILPHLATDATDTFTSDTTHSHSDAAFYMLEKYYIGVLKSAQVKDRLSQTKKKMDLLVDVSKPIIPQIPKLGNKYNSWVHSQYGLNKIIIFDSFLEAFTRWPWWYIFILWSPIVIYMLKRGLEHISGIQSVMLFVLGLLSWSIVEYTLHRFVFHLSTDTTMWNYFHFFAHGIHHLTPNDSTRLTFPPTFSAVIAFFLVQAADAAPPNIGLYPLFAGLVTGFVLYDTAHYYFHHGDVSWMPTVLQRMKSTHLNHHYKDDTSNFGVTSPLFDWIFGTLGK